MVGAPGSPALTPPSGSVVDIFYVDGGRSQIFASTSHEVVVDIFYVDGGHSCISVSTSQGAAVDVS
jgi:hypothetical protein